MPFDFQVTFDCSQPHVLADFWAEALGWNVEPQDEDFITSMIEQGRASESDTIRHRGALVWKEGAAIGAEIAGAHRRIYFETVPEPKTAKNRVHLDIRVGGESLAAERARLEGIGAAFLYDGRQGEHTWVTMADPEGNEFCVS
ncbi:MAG: VOC family protein [Acidimicrobiia bacterium]